MEPAEPAPDVDTGRQPLRPINALLFVSPPPSAHLSSQSTPRRKRPASSSVGVGAPADAKIISCAFCGRTFGRGSEKNRHEKLACPLRPDFPQKQQDLNLTDQLALAVARGDGEIVALEQQRMEMEREREHKRQQLNRVKSELGAIDKQIERGQARMGKRVAVLEASMSKTMPVTRAARPLFTLSKSARNRRLNRVEKVLTWMCGNPGSANYAMKRLLERNEQISFELDGRLKALHPRLVGKRAAQLKRTAEELKSNMAKSQWNVKRSLRILASGGDFQSREKYRQIRRILAESNPGQTERLPHSSVPLLSYDKLMREVQIDAKLEAQLHSAADLAENDDTVVAGVYRDLQPAALDLARKALEMFDHLTHECSDVMLTLSFGGDGFPNKHKSATTFDLTLLEFGERVHSVRNHTLLFGASVDETHKICTAFCRLLVREVDSLCASKFDVKFFSASKNCFVRATVSFKPGNFCADQKFLCICCGEQSNSAYRFSNFCGATQEQRMDKSLQIGNEPGMIPPTTYESRMRDHKKFLVEFERLSQKEASAAAAAVAAGKTRNDKPINDIRNAACRAANVRQIGEPPLGHLSSLIEICVLHVNLLAWGNYFKHLVGIFGARMASLTGNDVQARLLSVARDIGCNQLVNAIATKTRQAQNDGKPVPLQRLSFRLNGEMVRKLCHGFTSLTHELLLAVAQTVTRISATDKKEALYEIAYFHFYGVLLRQITATVSQSHATVAQVEEFEQLCHAYYNLKCDVRGGQYFSQNDFTIGKVLVLEAWKVFNDFGCGLGIASMQGREAKHHWVKTRLFTKTQPQRMWQRTFLLDYIQCYHMPVELRDAESVDKGKEANYIPSTSGCPICTHVDCGICANDKFRKTIWRDLERSGNQGMLIGNAALLLAKRE